MMLINLLTKITTVLKSASFSLLKEKSPFESYVTYLFDNVSLFRKVTIAFWAIYNTYVNNFYNFLPKAVVNALFSEEDIQEMNKKNATLSEAEGAKKFSIQVFPKLLIFLFVFMLVATRKSANLIQFDDFLLRSNYEITAGTEMIKSILILYSNMVVILFVIGIIVTSILIDSIVFYQDTNLNVKRAFVTHNQPLEFIWTTIPAIIVTLIAIPTLMWIYLSDRDLDPTLTVSVTGHQWYWNYKIMTNKFVNSDTDSFMLPANLDIQAVENFSEDPSYRYLKTDNYLVVPSIQKLRFMITSNDVIHSWAVPALGIKVDAVPGRATRLDVSINQEGLFYGQCSELCGVNHAFMPIGVDVVGAKHFLAHMRQ